MLHNYPTANQPCSSRIFSVLPALSCTRRLRRATLATAAGTLLLAAPAIAHDPTAGDVVLFAGTLGANNYGGDAAISQPLGWNIPGRNFRSGNGWWALACQAQCTLTSTAMTATPSTHPDYDGPPLPSQFLRWSPLPYGLDIPRPESGVPARTADAASSPNSPSAPILLALFKPVRGLAGLPLQGGPLTTWLHAGMGRYPGSNEADSMSVRIDMGERGKALLVPRLQAPPPNANPGDAPEANLVFELRVAGKRQRLGAYQWHLDGARPLQGPEYLLWAGDLDGDGKIDLLMNFTDYYWNTVLFLSSLAKPGELVGEAARFSYSPPDSPGC